jgi:transcriptional regulator with XRE-family HTH domain
LADHQLGFGQLLRTLREERRLPLRTVAHAADMDSTLLSKIELALRLPTEEQTLALAKFFGADAIEFESLRIAEKFLQDNGHNREAAALALARIQESRITAPVNKKRVHVNYRVKPVHKPKKRR